MQDLPGGNEYGEEPIPLFWRQDAIQAMSSGSIWDSHWW